MQEVRDFSEYILEMWESVSYTPGEIEIASLYDDDKQIDLSDIEVHQGERVFTPNQVKSQPSKWGGVSVKNFPRDDDHGKIYEFLFRNGLPDYLGKNVAIEKLVM